MAEVEGMKMVRKEAQIRNVKIERLKAVGGATTFGGGARKDAKIWMDNLQKCFHLMGCPQHNKLKLATLLLEGDAAKWWRNNEFTKKKHQTGYKDWNEFKKAFYQQYYTTPTSTSTSSYSTSSNSNSNSSTWDDDVVDIANPKTEFLNLMQLADHHHHHHDEAQCILQPTSSARPKLVGTPHTQGNLFLNTQQQQHHLHNLPN